jgi:hypothetical protein
VSFVWPSRKIVHKGSSMRRQVKLLCYLHRLLEALDVCRKNINNAYSFVRYLVPPTTTWKTRLHILKIQEFLSFHYIIFSNYSFVQCITIIFVLSDQRNPDMDRSWRINERSNYSSKVEIINYIIMHTKGFAILILL